ncbi:unnamed protein product [Ilex paraguariensis]|uniref:Uncharacterized protein n=1 Tax=Ilex paraguariensis TaxID=185542 RepID=A0ABC8QUK1_9AQUA
MICGCHWLASPVINDSSSSVGSQFPGCLVPCEEDNHCWVDSALSLAILFVDIPTYEAQSTQAQSGRASSEHDSNSRSTTDGSHNVLRPVKTDSSGLAPYRSSSGPQFRFILYPSNTTSVLVFPTLTNPDLASGPLCQSSSGLPTLVLLQFCLAYSSAFFSMGMDSKTDSPAPLSQTSST